MTLNLTKLESTRVTAASAEADFEKKSLQGWQITGHCGAQQRLAEDGTGV